MKPITVRITTTEDNQDILSDFIKAAITSFVPITRDLNTINLDLELLFESDYVGNITISDSEISNDVVSKAEGKLFYSYTGKISTLVIETSGTNLEAKIVF